MATQKKEVLSEPLAAERTVFEGGLRLEEGTAIQIACEPFQGRERLPNLAMFLRVSNGRETFMVHFDEAIEYMPLSALPVKSATTFDFLSGRWRWKAHLAELCALILRDAKLTITLDMRDRRNPGEYGIHFTLEAYGRVFENIEETTTDVKGYLKIL